MKHARQLTQSGLVCAWLILFFAMISTAYSQSVNDDLFVALPSSKNLPNTTNPNIVIRQRQVTTRLDVMNPHADTLQLNLFDDVFFVAQRDRIERSDSGGIAWLGHIQGQSPELSAVNLVFDNHKLSGSVMLFDELYWIRHLTDDQHVIYDIDRIALAEAVQSADAFADNALSKAMNSTEQQVFNLTNQERAALNIPLLKADNRLTQAARNHSQDMAINDFFSHTGSNGSSGGQRMSNQGYDWNTWGENIAAGYTSAQSVMNAWMNSSGHRANILRNSFCDLGVGVISNTNGRLYWTQNFACGDSGGSPDPNTIDNDNDGFSENQGDCNDANANINPNANDIANNGIDENCDGQDNTTASGGGSSGGGTCEPGDPPPPATATELQDGVAKSFTLAAGETVEFFITLPANISYVRFITTGPGNADMYVKRATINWPADQGFHNEAEFKASLDPDTYERVVIRSPAAGVWHILLHGKTNASGKITVYW